MPVPVMPSRRDRSPPRFLFCDSCSKVSCVSPGMLPRSTAIAIVRFVTVALVLTVSCAAQAQRYHFQPVHTPDLPPSTYVALDLVRTIQYLVAGAVVLAIPGWVILKIWASSRRSQDPQKLALADPWM